MTHQAGCVESSGPQSHLVQQLTAMPGPLRSARPETAPKARTWTALAGLWQANGHTPRNRWSRAASGSRGAGREPGPTAKARAGAVGSYPATGWTPSRGGGASRAGRASKKALGRGDLPIPEAAFCFVPRSLFPTWSWRKIVEANDKKQK